jgi:geranylgeranyl pyrophosphate synthase
VGAIIGGGSADEVEALGSFGRHLGTVCILRDDLEDTFNDLWELRSRILRESLPLPIVYSLGDKRCRDMLKDMFRKRPEDIVDAELEALIAIIDENHGFERGQALITRHVGMAKRAAKGLKEPGAFLSLFH